MKFFFFFLNVQPKCFSTPSSWPISCGIHDSASTSYQRENTHIYSKLSSSCSQPTKLNKTIYGKKIPYQFTPVCFFCRLTEGNLIHWICTGQCRTHEGEVGGQGGRGGRHQNWLHFDDVTASEKPNFLDGPQQNKLINWSVNRSSIHQKKKKICDLIIALRNWGKRFMLSTESSAEGKQQK